MSRRKDPLIAEIRAHIRRGRSTEACLLLSELERKDPDHPFLATARHCMKTGSPLPSPRSAQEKRTAQMLQHALAAFAAGNTDFRHKSNAWLRRTWHHSRTADPAWPQELRGKHRAFRIALRAERRRRLRRTLRWLGTWVLLAAGAATAYGTCRNLRTQAAAAAEALAAAHRADTAEAERTLALYDTGLNRLFHRRVGFESAALRHHLQARQRRLNEAEQLLQTLESGEHRVSDLPMAARAAIALVLQEQGAGGQELRRRWEACCERDTAALRRQKSELLHTLATLPPPLAALSDSPAAAAEELRPYTETLRKRLADWEEASRAFELNEATCAPLQTALQEAEALAQEITAYADTLALLPKARSYRSFRRLMRRYDFRRYAPACALSAAARTLPQEDAVLAAMQAHSHGVQAGESEQTVFHLMQGGPTFRSDTPATTEQMQEMQELFTNRALTQRLWLLEAPGITTPLLTEEEPQPQDGALRIRRSGLDPQKRVEDAPYVIWQHAELVTKRCIDISPLTKAAVPDRAAFLATINLPHALTAVLNTPAPCAPALARAYLYSRLLRLVELMPQQDAAGLRFSPTMQAHAATFRRMQRTLPVALDGNCWLQRTPATQQAEERCAAWFRNHCGSDYAAEIRRSLSRHLNTTAHYCGYINEQGQAVLAEPPAAGALLWYMGAKGLTHSPLGAPLAEPCPFSPVFTLNKR